MNNSLSEYWNNLQGVKDIRNSYDTLSSLARMVQQYGEDNGWSYIFNKGYMDPLYTEYLNRLGTGNIRPNASNIGASL